VLEDVIDEYVSIERARKDYGVVVRAIDPDLLQYEIDEEATAREREEIRTKRKGWLEEDPETVAARYRAGEIDLLDTIRRHGVIVDQRTGYPFPRTTAQFRETLAKRTVPYWD
jgi:N-methylhydantoinase B